MRSIQRVSVGVAVLAALLLIPTTAMADASVPANAEFGQHVRECAQTMGFSGTHNPGMHRGFAGWGGLTCDD